MKLQLVAVSQWQNEVSEMVGSSALTNCLPEPEGTQRQHQCDSTGAEGDDHLLHLKQLSNWQLSN